MTVWCFTRAPSAVSALSSIFPPKTRGCRLSRTDICISTAFGFPALSRGTAIPAICSTMPRATAAKRARSAFAFYPRQRSADFLPIRNFWRRYLPFFEGAEKPQFRPCAKHPHADGAGYVLYYTNQCPFTAKYVPVLEHTAAELNIPLRTVHITTKEQAQSAPTPITTYALFRNGEYVTNEVLNDKRFLKLIQG